MLSRAIQRLRDRKWGKLAWPGFFLILSLFIWTATLTPSYQQCADQYQSAYSNNKHYGSKQHAITFILCEGATIDANSALLTAVATIFVAGFTLTLWRATTEHSRLVGETLQLARDEFNATHRPKLRVRRISLVGFHERFDNAPIGNGEEINCILSIANIGDSTAWLMESKYRIFYRIDLPSGESLFERNPQHIKNFSFELKPGASHIFPINDKLFIPDEVFEIKMMHRLTFLPHSKKLCVIGNIWYEDNAKVSRSMGFCRELKSDRRFHSIDNPDYEYED